MGIITRGFLFLFLSLYFDGTAVAIPTYYTVQGNVGMIRNDGAGIIHDSGLSVGSQVTYTFMIDFAVQGSQRLNNGSVISVANSFYVDFISGTAFQEKNGGIHNGVTEIAEYNCGSFQYASQGQIMDTFLNVNSADNFLTLDILSNPTQWIVGRDFGTFSNFAYDSTGLYSWLLGGPLQIIDISGTPPAPVPEPSTYLLFGCGMLFLLLNGHRLISSCKQV